MNFWERKQIPTIKGPFHHVEELILYSFEVRIIALLHVQLREVNINIEDSKAVEEYLHNKNDCQRIPTFSRQYLSASF